MIRVRTKNQGSLSFKPLSVSSCRRPLYPPTTAISHPPSKVADLDARARALAVEVNGATHEASALREDAAVAARRAEEARERLAGLARETAQLSSEVNTLRATKTSLNSELAGLQHEFEALRGRVRGEWRGPRRPEPDKTRVIEAKGKDRIGMAPVLDVRACLRSEEICMFGGGTGGVNETDQGGRDEVTHRGLVGGGSGIFCNSDRGDCGNLVDIVAEFQGRLRRQVRAALAEGGGGSAVPNGDGLPVSRDGEALAQSHRSRQRERVLEGVLRAEHKRGDLFIHACSSHDVLGELDKRISSV